MSFPLIGSKSTWDNWNNAGFGSWRMWFMAPYGSWIYAGFVKNDTPQFKKINIGDSQSNFEIINWDFGLASNTPEDIFTHEQHEGYPDGAMGMGCIRSDGGTPYLYLVGRDPNKALSSTDNYLHRFDVDSGFEANLPGQILQNSGGSPISVNRFAGIEVVPGSAIFAVLNNQSSNEYELLRYAESGSWNGSGHTPTHSINLSPVYIENNTLSRIRGIGLASDGNVIIFINSGVSSTSCKVLKFDADDLSFLGETTWVPDISSATWAYITQASEVFILAQGLDTNNYLNWKTAVYYDRATAIPDANKSNFIIADNLTSFGSNTSIALTYEARDAFNIPVENTPCKFVIDGEDEDSPDSWNDRVGGIQDSSGAAFFDASDVPLAIAATVNTNSSGIATAYYRPMRAGTGTEIDTINVVCPAS